MAVVETFFHKKAYLIQRDFDIHCRKKSVAYAYETKIFVCPNDNHENFSSFAINNKLFVYDINK